MKRQMSMGRTLRAGAIPLLALVMTLGACQGRRTVVDPVTGEQIDNARTRIGLAVSDFSVAFVTYGDTVVALRDQGILGQGVANNIIESNIQVLDAADAVTALLRDQGNDQSVFDAVETLASQLGRTAALDSLPEAARRTLLAAQSYITVALEIARASLGGE